MTASLDGYSQFQLNARKTHYTQGSSLSTRAWILELPRDHIKEHFPKFLNTFGRNHPVCTIVPLFGSTTPNDRSLRQLFYNQNRLLTDHRIVCVDNLFGLDNEPLPDTTPNHTLRMAFLEQLHSTDKQSLFRDISQQNSGRVSFLIPHHLLDEATQRIDQFISDFLPSLPPDIQLRFSKPDKAPVRVGSRSVPTNIKLFLDQFKDIETSPETPDDEASQITTYSQPPLPTKPGNQWGSYASAVTGHTLPTAPPTPARTILSDITSNQLTAANDRITKLLEEVNNTNNTVKEQTARFEQRFQQFQDNFNGIQDQINKLLQIINKVNDTNTHMQQQINTIQAHQTLSSSRTHPLSPLQKQSKQSLAPPPLLPTHSLPEWKQMRSSQHSTII